MGKGYSGPPINLDNAQWSMAQVAPQSCYEVAYSSPERGCVLPKLCLVQIWFLFLSCFPAPAKDQLRINTVLGAPTLSNGGPSTLTPTALVSLDQQEECCRGLDQEQLSMLKAQVC